MQPPHDRSHDASDYWILLGYHQLRNPTEHSLHAAVNNLIIHAEFNKPYFMARDIALLQLHLAVNFTPYMLPACLPGPSLHIRIHTTCWTTGWGMCTETGEQG